MYCPHYSQQLAESPEIAGREVNCPYCSGRFTAPGVPPVPPIVIRSIPRGVSYRPRRPGTDGMLAAILSLFLPGLGQLCQGRVAIGLTFLFMWFVCLLASFLIVGIPFLLIVWIWAVVEAAQG